MDEAPTVARSGESGVRTGSAAGGADPAAGDTDPDPGDGYSGITPSGRWSARSIDLRPQKFDPRQIRAYTGLNQFTIDPASMSINLRLSYDRCTWYLPTKVSRQSLGLLKP